MIFPRRGVALLLLIALLALSAVPARAGLLVSSAGSDQVLEYDNTGSFVRIFASGNGLTSPQGLAFGPNGNLFVSSKNQILEYDGQSGAFVTAFVPPDDKLKAPAGLVFGPNGNLFISSFGSGQVLQYNGTTGAFINVFASGNGLTAPEGLLFGPNGDLFVSSFATSQVLEYDGTTGTFNQVFASGNGLAGPMDLVFGPNGNLFVSSSANNRVLQFDGTTGAFIGIFAATGLSGPNGLVFGPNGNLFVSSQNNNTVLEYDGVTGALVSQFVGPGLGGLDTPTFLTFSPAGGTPRPVPEPSTLVVFGLGSVILAAACCRRRRNPSPAAVCPPTLLRKESTMNRFRNCLLLLVLAAVFGLVATPAHAEHLSGSLWYNGDWNGRQSLSNGRNTSIAPVANVYDNFIVPAGAGWDVTGLYADNITSSFQDFISVDYTIRSGMNDGKGGTIVFSEQDPPLTIIPTGEKVGDLEVMRFLITGLKFHLDPGEYWLNVTPVGAGKGISFLAATDGLNAVGTPPGNDDRSYWYRPDINIFFYSTTQTSGPGYHDFSQGVIGNASGFGSTSIPEPSSLALLSLFGCTLAVGRLWKRGLLPKLAERNG